LWAVGYSGDLLFKPGFLDCYLAFKRVGHGTATLHDNPPLTGPDRWVERKTETDMRNLVVLFRALRNNFKLGHGVRLRITYRQTALRTLTPFGKSSSRRLGAKPASSNDRGRQLRRPLSFRVKLGLLSFSFLEQLRDSINRYPIIDRAYKPSVALDLLVEFNALVTHSKFRICAFGLRWPSQL
jgi:hypothetical protein